MLNVECVGRYLQSLSFYVKNDKFNAVSLEYRNEIEE